MGLHFIIGEDGSGKTTWVYDSIMQGIQKGEQSYLLVPEQANLQAERELCARTPGHCIMLSNITSFNRLRYLLSAELGDRIPNVLQDTGKGMILKLLLRRHAKELTIYRGKERKQGFVGQVRSVISEMGQYAVTEEHLASAKEHIADPILKKKLNDICKVYTLFREYLGEGQITEEEVLLQMIPMVEESDEIAGKTFYFDGYTGFTPCQLALMEAILKKAGDCYVTITMSREEYERGADPERPNLFQMSHKTVKALTQICKQNGITVEEPHFTEHCAKSENMEHLTKSLFRPMNGTKKSMKVNDIQIWNAKNRRQEVRFVVSQIKKMIVEQGYRYRDIGILCGDVEGYSTELISACLKAEIPYYIDYKENALTNPVVDYLRAALRVLKTDFSREAVCQYMKNPLSDITIREASLVDNYLMGTGIRGYRRFCAELTRKPKSTHNQDLDTVAGVMSRICEELKGLREAFEGKADVVTVLKALYDFMLKRGLEEKADKLAEEFGNRNDGWALRKQKECSQVYEALILVINQMASILGDEVLTAEEFAETMDAGLEEMKLGIIPPQQDTVVVGDVKRSRVEGVRVLFFIGMNEGVVPGIHHSSGLFTDQERRTLLEEGIEMADTIENAHFTEEFYLYLALGKPTEKLYLTYPRAGEDGKELRPSTVLYQVQRLFSNLSLESVPEVSFETSVAIDQGESYLVEGLRRFRNEKKVEGNEDVLGLLKRMLQPSDEKPNKYDLVHGGEAFASGYSYEIGQSYLSKETAQELYGDVLAGSVTRLEDYAKCPFLQFAKYGMKLEERPEYGVSTLDQGNLSHEVLQELLSEIKKIAKDSDFASVREVYEGLTEEQMAAMVDRVVEAKLQEKFAFFKDNSRFHFQMEMVREDVNQTFRMIRKHILSGHFAPFSFEEKFHKNTDFMDFSGKIDRLDIAEGNGRRLVKVIDYKSSDHSIKPASVYDGVQLQLPIYLRYAAEKYGATPAAAFYMHVDDPIVNDCENPDQEREKKAIPTGLFADDKDIVKCLDDAMVCANGELTPGYSSEVIKGIITKSGTWNKNSSKNITSDQMNILCDYANLCSEKQAEDILAGKISVLPYGGECGYCGFKNFCRVNQANFKGKTKTTGTIQEIFKMMEDKVCPSDEQHEAGGNGDE